MIVKCNDIKYKIYNKDDEIQKYLIYNLQWNEPIYRIIKNLIQRYDLKHLVNVGSHIGTMAIPISYHINKVTAIEAHPQTYKHLQENISLNNCTNIQTYNNAVGATDDTAYFLSLDGPRLQNNNGGMHVITESDIKDNRRSASLTDKKYNINMIPLDTLNIIGDIYLVDIEGSENEFLDGAIDSLRYCKIIIIELWDDNKRKLENMTYSQNEMKDKIEDMGFTFKINISDDFIFIRNF